MLLERTRYKQPVAASRRACRAASCVLAILLASCGDVPPDTQSALVSDYVESVVQRVAIAATLDQAVKSAFSSSDVARIQVTPEGIIEVSAGFLFVAAGESELACAIAHELAHIERIRSDSSEGQGTASGGVATRSTGDGAERAADLAAIELCWKAGYDPRGLPILLARFADLLRQDFPNESLAAQARADVLHEFLDGRDWTGELGYARYQDTVSQLVETEPDRADTLPAEGLVGGRLIVRDSQWIVDAYNLEENGKEETVQFILHECASKDGWSLDFIPTNEIDAFGHCWYGCEGTRRIGEDTTWLLGRGREEWREIERELGIADHDSYRQDIANQTHGRSLAGEEGTCRDLCTRALDDTLDRSAPERMYYECWSGDVVPGGKGVEVSHTDSAVGYSWGDPHIVTGDGFAYALQSAGELVAIESLEDDLEVQVRQEFWSSARDVSQNTAVAARLHDDVVGFYVVDNTMLVHVNGNPYEPGDTWSSLPGGGEVRSGYESVYVRWQDASTLQVRLFISFLNIYFEPATNRSGRIGGLLGNFNGLPADDLRTRDGSVVELPPVDQPGFAPALYEQFGDSWRVRPGDSLFDYPEGMTALGHDEQGLPDRLATVAELDEATRERAAAVCRDAGLRTQPILDDCIVDVGFTGRPEFALAAAHAASAARQRSVDHELAANGIHVLDRFAASAGDRYFFQFTKITGSLDLSTWELVAPSGDVVDWQCLRCNQPGSVELPESGVYTTRVEVADNESGRLRSLLHPIPPGQMFELELPAVIAAGSPQQGAGRIETAGALDTYRFEGAAGTTLRLSLESADPTLYFGEWSLQSPSGDDLFSGLLPGPPSRRSVRLPESGAYVLRLTGGDRWPADMNAGYGNYRILIETLPDQEP